MNTIKIVKIISLVSILVLFLGISPATASANSCDDENPRSQLKVVEYNKTPHDDTETMTIKNTSSECEHSVNLSSYKLFIPWGQSGWLSTQEFYKNKTVVIAPGEEEKISIGVPGSEPNEKSCAYQVDAYVGDVIDEMTSSGHEGVGLSDGWSVIENSSHPLCSDEVDEPEFSVNASCNLETGISNVEVTTSTGLDSYDLFNIANSNTSIASGSNTSTGSITDSNFNNLPNGNYRFEGTLGNNSETQNFTIDCDEEKVNISGQCEVSPRNIESGESVTWSASASGGDGSYTYSWNLEGNDDDADTKSITTFYLDEGTYSGTVTISDGDLVIQRTCSISVDDGGGGGGGGDRLPPRDDDGEVRGDRDVFGVQCLPEKSAYLVGEVVTFNATVDGDIDEDDAEFSWNGHDSIDWSNQRATAQYTTPGVKEISVRAEYDGDTERDTCFVQIARSGVTLDHVPYTGPGDIAKTAGFIMGLLLLATAGGYAMIRRREETGIPVGIPTKNN